MEREDHSLFAPLLHRGLKTSHIIILLPKEINYHILPDIPTNDLSRLVELLLNFPLFGKFSSRFHSSPSRFAPAGQKMSFVFRSKLPISLPIAGLKERFPIRRVYCVGQNYAGHAKEMGHAKADPFFFSKPSDAVVEAPTARYPVTLDDKVDYHHEVELVVAIGKNGKNIASDKSKDYIYGYTIGFDMTRRDLQKIAKEKGRPWDLAKGGDDSAPCGVIAPMPGVVLAKGAISLSVNDTRRQHGDLSDMVLNVPDMISYLSRFVELEAGDLIFTGTPEGVGPVKRGDVLRGSIEGVGSLEVTIV